MHPKNIRALVLVPTRELAVQVQQSFVKYAKGTDIRIGIAYGGVSIEAQQAEFKAGIDVLIATPGRLLDHLRQGALNLKRLSVLVFDEADRMLDMGFMDEIKAVLKQVPAQRQTLLFSATLDDSIFGFSKTFCVSLSLSRWRNAIPRPHRWSSGFMPSTVTVKPSLSAI